ncbi:MAG: thiolase family protein [Candidatus Binatia bacterium]
MSNNLRGKYAIVGVGQSPLGKVPDLGPIGLFAVAAKNALEDAGLSKDEVDGLITRGPDDVYCHHQRVGQALGMNVTFSTSTDSGGASQVLSVAMACMAIDAGLCHTVITGYGRDTFSRTHRSVTAKRQVSTRDESLSTREFGPEFGQFGAPINYAISARRHMQLYGTKKEQLGAIAVAFRNHASKNSNAFFRQKLTMEEYLGARLIVDPFCLYDCSIFVDGAGAVVVTSAERARHLKKSPAYILGFGFGNRLSGWFNDDNMITTGAKEAGEGAYRMAGVSPADVDTAQIYDCFTQMVLLQLEDYGFCKKGEGGPFAGSGALEFGGSLPTNTSGGQLSEGHVEGMLQVVEGVRQVRREYGPDRQVKDAEIALVTGHGGNTVCQSALILGREAS